MMMETINFGNHLINPWWCHVASWTLVTIGSGHDFLPEDTKAITWTNDDLS